MKIFEKAMEIRNLLEGMNTKGQLISSSYSYIEKKLEIHVYSADDFIKIAEENRKRYKVKPFDSEYGYDSKYKFTTEHEGVEFLTLANSEEYEYILDKLF